tara:strand:+ start:11310 stop:14090 length:2781 start_codon:yes stop_codon:yes gene_type:complete
MSSESVAASFQPKITVPDIPALHIDASKAYILSQDGEILTLSHNEARRMLHNKSVLLCHAPYCKSKLDLQEVHCFDVLELFAFVHPKRFTVPTPRGLCKSLFLKEPSSVDDTPMSLVEATQTLLKDIQSDPLKAKADPLSISAFMGLNGKAWPWTPFIHTALGETYDPNIPVEGKRALAVWKNLAEWAEEAPPPPASHYGVSEEEAHERLLKIRGFDDAEKRENQVLYSKDISHAFAPIENEYEPHITLAEAGTGVGKTLGYLSPASVWAEKNKGTVWISTYTKNLQRQIDQELDRLYPVEEVKDAHIATRKGRENYLCLLNLEEAASGAALAKHITSAIACGLMARWTAASKDGDLTGSDFPGWLSGILGFQYTFGLADKRGECIYSGCDHYKKCFVEHSVRKAEHARLVIANHALVMISAALSSPGETMPTRYVFDEGHHLFSAADSAYASHLSARETRDFRRWLMGAEGGRRQSRSRGLKRRIEDLIEGMGDAEEQLRKITLAAECLPLDGWTRRIRDSAPMGPTEKFIFEIYIQVNARANGKEGPYSLETEAQPVNEPVLLEAVKLKKALKELQTPMQELSRILNKKLSEDQGEMSGDTRKRMEAVSTSLERRADHTLQSWIIMLEQLSKGAKPPEFIDWMEITRSDGHAVDVGLYRHYVDPMKPFADSMRPHAHGIAVTSATLRDNANSAADDEESWQSAAKRAGTAYLTKENKGTSYSSPFNYTEQSKVIIINDVNKNDMGQLSNAYQNLFTASGGAGLGLFTAISRLKAVYSRINESLEDQNIHLYAQHIDQIDTGTLVDMFRDDIHSCLLGTDAIRDGVDVPGDSLKMIIFDRCPWPRPTILHKARKEAFGGKEYDEMLTRLKLKQAFGRLIRRKNDKGIFVMMDNALPSRLHNAFPSETEIIKTDLKSAIKTVQQFL